LKVNPERGLAVRFDRRGFWRRASDLGLGILILSLVHVPLPQADYHNIRHHDAAGEICGYHDHLLRWHPSADLDDDVTMLHWHWFVPVVEFGDHHQGPDDEHHGPGPSVHAQFGDWPAPDWHGDPVVHPDSRGRLLDHLVLGQSDASIAYLSGDLAPIDPQSGRFCFRAHYPPGALRASRTALFQRWNC
jgi:hypothetical protein